MKEFHAIFERTVQYPVTVEVPTGTNVVTWPDGTKRILVMEPPVPGTAPMSFYITLQEAAERGIVKAKPFNYQAT